jgi:lysozyme
MIRTTSQAGREIIKTHEGLYLVAYLDPVGIWTIGWGHTRTARKGMRITLAEAQLLLASDLEEFERCILRRVEVPLSQWEFDALVSLAFNIGCGAFGGSTLLRRLNAGDREGAAAEFPRWRLGGGRILPGLVRRRRAEQALFMEGGYEYAEQNRVVDDRGRDPHPVSGDS